VEKYLKDYPEWATHYVIYPYKRLETLTNAVILFTDAPLHSGVMEHKFIQIQEEDWYDVKFLEICDLPKHETDETSDL